VPDGVREDVGVPDGVTLGVGVLEGVTLLDSLADVEGVPLVDCTALGLMDTLPVPELLRLTLLVGEDVVETVLVVEPLSERRPEGLTLSVASAVPLTLTVGLRVARPLFELLGENEKSVEGEPLPVLDALRDAPPLALPLRLSAPLAVSDSVPLPLCVGLSEPLVLTVLDSVDEAEGEKAPDIVGTTLYVALTLGDGVPVRLTSDVPLAASEADSAPLAVALMLDERVALGLRLGEMLPLELGVPVEDTDCDALPLEAALPV
jgi:hypothetical protein